jgi:hypothetical protein
MLGNCRLIKVGGLQRAVKEAKRQHAKRPSQTNLTCLLSFFIDQQKDLMCLLEVIKLVGLYPPGRRLHQQIGVVIAIGKKSIKREPDRLPPLGDFLLAYLNDFLFE